jgi:hypothetical protein
VRHADTDANPRDTDANPRDTNPNPRDTYPDTNRNAGWNSDAYSNGHANRGGAGD